MEEEEDIDDVRWMLEADEDDTPDEDREIIIASDEETLAQEEKDIYHLMTSYKKKVYDKETVIKRLIEMELQKADYHLCDAFEYEDAESVEILLAAGSSPQSVLKLSVMGLGNYLKKDRKWKMLVPHWTAEDVIKSELLDSAIVDQAGERMLQLLEDLGMDFHPCISSSDTAATKCMQTALYHRDSSTVQYLVDHEFDVNTCFDLKPILHHLSGWFEPNYVCGPHSLVMNVIKLGANPLLKDSTGGTAIDAFIDCACRGHWRGSPIKILQLFIRMGFRVASSKLIPIQTKYPYSEAALSENSLVPSLKSLCRLQIRLAKGSRIEEFMALYPPDQYPRNLNDFVLLKDIDFDELHIDEYA